MPNPQEIVISTEHWDTFKNDDYTDTPQLLVPGSISVPALPSMNTYQQDVEIGENGAMLDVRVKSSRDMSKEYILGGTLSAGDITGVNGFTRTGSLGTYQIFVIAFYISPGVVRLQAFIPNPYFATMTGQSGDETFYFKIRTYEAPF